MLEKGKGTKLFLSAGLLLVSLGLFSSCTDGPTGPTNNLDPGNRDEIGVVAGTSNPDGSGQGQNKPRFIIKLADGHNPRAVAEELGVEPDHVFTHVIRGFAGAISEAAREGLLRDSRVVSVEKDVDLIPQGDVTQQWGATWGLDRIDQRQNSLSGYYGYERTGSGVTVYVVDSGIRYTHAEFGGRAIPGFDAFGGDGSDCYGHGTHVAGTVGGAVYGVAKGVDLVSVKVLNCGGWGSGSGMMAGMEWIIANRQGPSVANFSLAFEAGNGGPSVLDEAFQNLIASGVTVVAAAANYSSDACDYVPARVREAITVGSTGRSDQRSSFSNWGRCVDWFAPGEGVSSASSDSDTGISYKSGTSMAAPHTAGVAALLLEATPSASPSWVQQTLGEWTTKSVVGDAQSKNDHLLFSLGDPGTAPPSNQPPSADFSFVCLGLECAFTDQSIDSEGSVVSWTWSFGTQGESTERNPTFTFGESGEYSVSLTVTDNEGATATRTKDVPVSGASQPVNQPPTAGFSFSCEDLLCQFSDESSDPDGTLVHWAWSFGAEGTSEEPNPTFAFEAGGTHQVSLSVTDDDGAVASAAQEITVTEPPPPAPIQLTASGSKMKGRHQVHLLWSGANGAQVDLFRDGSLVGPIPNSGEHLDELSGRGKATYLYRVCEEGTPVCSDEVEVVF